MNISTGIKTGVVTIILLTLSTVWTACLTSWHVSLLMLIGYTAIGVGVIIVYVTRKLYTAYPLVLGAAVLSWDACTEAVTFLSANVSLNAT